MLADLRYAIRMLLRAPGFTAVALLTLALGIGANTAIFTLVNATMMRMLPVGHPEQLSLLTDPSDMGMQNGSSGGRRGLLAYTEYTALRDRDTAFSALMAAESGTEGVHVQWNGADERARMKEVSANYFSGLEVPAFRGRAFAPGEGAVIGADPIAVMSYAYWTRRFNRNPAAVGSVFHVHGQALTVIGITPPDFNGENIGQSPDLYVPLTMAGQVTPGFDRLHDAPGVSRVMWLQVIGRRKPGVTQAQAQAASNVVFQQLVQQIAGAATNPEQRHQLLDQHLELAPGGEGTSAVRSHFGSALLTLFALVGLVLLLAVVNLASLLLARAAAREKEIGVRLALGAARKRIVRQLLTESVLLSIIGGLLGAALALGGERLLLAMVNAGDNGVGLSLAPDWRVLGFVAALCVLTGLLFGLAPALRMARQDLNRTLQAQGRGGSGRTRATLGKALITGQVALSFVLLLGASLFVRSLTNLANTPLGFNPDHLYEVGLDFAGAGYKGPAADAALRKATAALANVPGVISVSYSDNGVLEGSDCGIPIGVDGFKPANGRPGTGVGCDAVGDHYFETLQDPILMGRPIGPQDETGPRTAVINQTAAKLFFAGRSPIGGVLHDLYPDDLGATYTVVGVAGDIKHNTPAEKVRPRMFFSAFHPFPGSTRDSEEILVRASGEPASGIRAALQQVDPNLAGSPVDPATTLIADALTTQRLLAQ
ncbi:MAG TPA: ADOP family duplicated permease, partial [Terriglobales bacterium]